jgi:hypothetical protein
MEKFSTIFHWCEGLFPALIALAQGQRKRVSIGSCSGPRIREEIRFDDNRGRAEKAELGENNSELLNP